MDLLSVRTRKIYFVVSAVFIYGSLTTLPVAGSLMNNAFEFILK